MWAGIVWIGLVMAIVSLVAFDLGMKGGLSGGSGDPGLARTMAFTTLVLAQLFNCFNARSGTISAFRRPFTNPALWGAVGLSLLLQVIAVAVPLFNEAFGTVPLSLDEWLACAALASVVLLAGEAWKLGARRLAR
jgi:magnesium-transporting ATPase (P-type)